MVEWRDYFRRPRDEEEAVEEIPLPQLIPRIRQAASPRMAQNHLNFLRIEEQQTAFWTGALQRDTHNFNTGNWAIIDDYSTIKQPTEKENKDMAYDISLREYPEGYLQFCIKQWEYFNNEKLPVKELTESKILLSRASFNKLSGIMDFGASWGDRTDGGRSGRANSYSMLNGIYLTDFYKNLPEEETVQKAARHFDLTHLAVNNAHSGRDLRDHCINFGTAWPYIEEENEETLLNFSGKEFAVKLHKPNREYLRRHPEYAIKDSNGTLIAFYSTRRQRIMLLFNPCVGDVFVPTLDYIYRNATEITGSPEMYKKEMQKYIDKGTKELLASTERAVQDLRDTQRDLERRLKSTHDTLRVNQHQLNAYRASFTVGIDVDRLVNEINKNASVKAFRIQDNHLKFRTGLIEHEFDNVVYSLGEFNVDVDLETADTKIQNLSKGIPDQHDHPHVRRQNPCWGDTPPLIEAFSKGEFGMGIDLLIRYLESVDVGDEWGCSLVRFPIKEFKGEITEKTLDVMIASLYSFDRDAYREIQENMGSKREILMKAYPKHFPQIATGV